MYVVVSRSVTDPAAFWGAAQQAPPNLPEGLRLHRTFPSPDGTKAIYFWEAGSVATLRDLIGSGGVAGQPQRGLRRGRTERRSACPDRGYAVGVNDAASAQAERLPVDVEPRHRKQ